MNTENKEQNSNEVSDELYKQAEEFADKMERRGCGAWRGLRLGFIAGKQHQSNTITEPIKDEEIEKLAEKEYPTIENKEFKSHASANILTKLCRSSFIKGYKANPLHQQNNTEVEAIDNWIGVDEVMSPDYKDDFLVLFSDGRIRRYKEENEFPLSLYTHWQPLPKLPNQ